MILYFFHSWTMPETLPEQPSFMTFTQWKLEWNVALKNNMAIQKSTVPRMNAA